MLNGEDQNESIVNGSQVLCENTFFILTTRVQVFVLYQELQETVEGIISDIPPPTKEEINQSRVTANDDESHMNKRATRTTPLKVFPIFEKGFVDTTRSKGSVKKLTPMNFLTRTEKHDGSLTQTVIDAG